ncbi:MAG TPA: LamG-like jellyroll fold domain-containing protein, partial [Solirubrobacterales bacterium]|nr:LamG-like jellyroll fold domain-containing protein [Solirubrobacterales bacterium]
MSYESVIKEDSPKGYWRLGESSGTEAKDSSGNAQNGTYKNAPTLGVAGAIGLDSNTAVSLAAASKQWVSIPDSATLDLGDILTYEAWVKRVSTGTGQTILDKGSGSLIVRFLANNKVLVRRNGVANICESTVAVTDTTSWHHIVVTKNGATVKIYIDGVDVTGTVTNSTLVNTAVVLGIGAADAGEEEFFNGSIDEVAVYGTALSKARVEAHRAAGLAKAVEGKGAGAGTGSGTAAGTRGRLGQGSSAGAGTGSAAGTRERQGKGEGAGVGSGTGSGVRTAQGKGQGAGSGAGQAGGTRGRLGKGAGAGSGSGAAAGTVIGPHLTYEETVLTDGPHGYWRLGEAAGATVAADASGHGNGGAYKNSVELGITGGLITDTDTSASFNTGGTLEKDHILVPGSGTLDLGDTFTLEAWIRRDGTGLTDCILDKGEGSFIFRFDGADHLLLRRNGVADIARSTTKIADSKWHHVVATKSGASVHIYVDGVDVTGTVTNSACTNTSVALTIGASNAGEEDFFRGGIDEVAVYPFVLSVADVERHFKAGAVPVPPLNTVAPAVAGSLELGATLTADHGTWANAPTSYAYQWQVSDKEGTGFVGIVGANSATYVVQGQDVGRYLRCAVTATNASGQTVAASAPGHVEGAPAPARLWRGSSISDYFRQSAPGAITEVSDPAGSGRNVFRFDVHKADVFPVTPTEDPRAQLAGPVLEIGEGFVDYPFVDGSEVWVEFAFRLPSEGLPGKQPSWFQIIQLFGPPFEGVAPWAIKAASDFSELIWQRNATYGFDIPWEAPASRDHWTRGLLHLRLAEDGWVEMWIDGKEVTFFAPGSSYNPGGEPETTRLEMATLDASNDGSYGSTIFLQNYWDAGSFEETVLYHEPVSVWLGLTGAAPVVRTDAVAGLTGTKATLRGTLDNPGGLPATYWFQYTTLADYEA